MYTHIPRGYADHPEDEHLLHHTHDHTDHSTFGEFFIITKVPNEGTVRDEVPSFVPSCVRSKQGTEGKKVTFVSTTFVYIIP